MSVCVNICINSEQGDLWEYEINVGADSVIHIARMIELLLSENFHESRIKRVH